MGFSFSLSSFSLGAVALLSVRFRDARDGAREGGLLPVSDFLRDSDFFRDIAGDSSSEDSPSSRSAAFFVDRIELARDTGGLGGRAFGAPSFFNVSLSLGSTRCAYDDAGRLRTHQPNRP